MVTGSEMTGFAQVLGLDGGRTAKSYSVDELEIRVDGRPTVNVLTPGEQAESVAAVRQPE